MPRKGVSRSKRFVYCTQPPFKARIKLLAAVLLVSAFANVYYKPSHYNNTFSTGNGFILAERAQRNGTNLQQLLTSGILIEQIFTNVKGTSSPCYYLVKELYTDDLYAAKVQCLSTPGCTSASRHRITGRTRLCQSAYRPNFKRAKWHLPALWSTIVLGGCHDLHDQRLPLFHLTSGALFKCGLLGLADFNFLEPKRPLSCTHIVWSGFTDSLQVGCLRCSAYDVCSHLVREHLTGRTVLCGDQHTNKSDLYVHETMRTLDESSTILMLQGVLTSSEASKSFHFVLGSVDCAGVQFFMRAKTESVEHAALICQAEMHCTVFSRENRTNYTNFCQGYRRLELSPIGTPRVVGFKLGCEQYAGEMSFAQAISSTIPRCQPFRQKCPGQLHPVPINTRSLVRLPQPLVCDECTPGAICPTLPATLKGANPVFEAAMQKVIAKLMSPFPHESTFPHNKMRFSNVFRPVPQQSHKLAKYGAINPSIFSHGSKKYIVFRITSALRCKGTSKESVWQLDQSLEIYHSHVGICEVSQSTLLPLESTCRRVANPTFISNLESKYQIDTRSTFSGPEDPRGFSFNGKMYVLCNIGLEVILDSREQRERYPDGITVRRIVLLTISKEGAVHRALILKLPDSENTRDDKNIVPIVGNVVGKSLYVVYSIFPFKICAVNLISGDCISQAHPTNFEIFHKKWQATKEELIALGPWRGSTPFVQTSYGYLGLIHRKQDLELGRLYTHKWMLLSSQFPHVPIWMSAPFRLPSNLRYSDIQFAAGIYFTENAAVISYGVADCISSVKIFEVPHLELRAAQSASTLRIIHPTSLVLDPVKVAGPHIRWDGPVSDLSGFATVAREMCKIFMAAPGFRLSILNLHDGSEMKDPLKNKMIYDRVVVSHSDLAFAPDITIRFHWPPNFNRVSHGKLVIYLPWEFGSIPKTWVDLINDGVDEVWTPSPYVSKGLQASGVNQRIIFELPHGVPTNACVGELPQRVDRVSLIKSRASMRILYHGGMLWRKGIDLLLRAYAISFKPSDDVVLIIHSVYGDEMVFSYVERYLKDHHAELGEVQLIKRGLTDGELSTLYRACDILVHPSRSEGFGLGIIEAMAHGLPVLAPMAEPMTDFVNERNGYLILSNEVTCDREPCYHNGTFFKSSDWEVLKPLRWHEFHPVHAAHLLRKMFENRIELTTKRSRARNDACRYWGWNRTRDIVLARIKQMSDFGPLHGEI